MPKPWLKIAAWGWVWLALFRGSLKSSKYTYNNPRNKSIKIKQTSFYTLALILALNLNIFQCILWQPLIEDISKFPTLEIKSKIKIQKGELFFFFLFHAPHSETAHTIRKFSQNRSELISENSKIRAHLISDGLICGGQLSHLRRQASRW